MTDWFTSDHHLGHKGIINLVNRPFESESEMTNEIIKRHNSVVSDRDTVYVLGDFCWGDPSKYISRMNGNIFLVPGNHDNINKWLPQFILRDIYLYKKNHIGIVLCHYPLREWEGFFRNYIHLFGHVHNSLPNYKRSMDIGIDSNNFYPYSFGEICDRLDGIINV